MNARTAQYTVMGLALSAAAAFAVPEAAKESSTPVAVVSAEEIIAAPAISLEDRVAALELLTAVPAAPAKTSSWTDKVTIKGDARFRYEYQAKDSDTDKSRSRLRGRVGAYADVNDETKVGIRLATGSDESPTSTNQDIDEFGSEKAIWLDLVYITYSPEYLPGFSGTLGKMKQPWTLSSDLIFDSDFNPEGLSASQKLVSSEGFDLSSQFGYFTMAEEGTEDVNLGTAQLIAKADISEDIDLTASMGAFLYGNLEGYTIPTFGTKVARNGNTDDGVGNYMYGYELVDGSVILNIKKGPLPFKVFGELVNNLADNVSEDTAWLVGVGTKVKKVSLSYNYRDMEADSVLGALADGDFGGPGGKGHKVKASYPLAKNLNLDLIYQRINTISDVDIDKAQVDVSVKF
ncbi:MAG: putative porin [Pontiellaceae bacterium]|nr:putative porin [Pontiellaceae bacterium]MBN2786276.1 putative porin [Pontiellaceae bacterium]